MGLLSGIDNELVGLISGLGVRYCAIHVQMLEYDTTGTYTYVDMDRYLVMIRCEHGIDKR